MEDRWGTPPSAEDRLSALRAPLPGPAHAPQEKDKKHRSLREILLGLALVLVGSLLAVFLLGRSGTTQSVATEVTASTVPTVDGRPGKGMALFAALVEAGAYPPAIREGDIVLVVVTPSSSSESVTRALPDLATVTDVSEASTISGGVVVSMIGPDSMPPEIADAAEVHLSVVGGQ